MGPREALFVKLLWPLVYVLFRCRKRCKRDCYDVLAILMQYCHNVFVAMTVLLVLFSAVIYGSMITQRKLVISVSSNPQRLICTPIIGRIWQQKSISQSETNHLQLQAARPVIWENIWSGKGSILCPPNGHWLNVVVPQHTDPTVPMCDARKTQKWRKRKSFKKKHVTNIMIVV